jgi:hypothetical protein
VPSQKKRLLEFVLRKMLDEIVHAFPTTPIMDRAFKIFEQCRSRGRSSKARRSRVDHSS